MELTPLNIKGAWLASSHIWVDARGSFCEWFKASEVFEATGVHFDVQQANISQSNRGVIRGIHYSLSSCGQAKWVTCVKGKIMDIVVDIRPSSVTYGEYLSIDLVAGDGRAVLIGQGLGHAFISLEDETTVSYLLSSPYSPGDEYEINPLDPKIGINWNLNLVDGTEIILSQKDSAAPSLSDRAADGKLPD